MTWTNLTFNFGSVLTSAQMTNLYNNFDAFANQDSGAPSPGSDFITSASQLAANVVGASELAASAVQNTHLAKTTSAGSHAVGTSSYYTLPAGVYILTASSTGMYLEVNFSGIGWTPVDFVRVSDGTSAFVISDGSNFRMHNNSAINSSTLYYRNLS
jgi:hypothetical protein